jgi:hypothetical protein
MARSLPFALRRMEALRYRSASADATVAHAEAVESEPADAAAHSKTEKLARIGADP